MARVAGGSKFYHYFDSVIQALRQLGGSGRPGEVVEIVAKIKNVSENQRQEVLSSGALRFDKQIAFARQYLVWGGYLGSSKRGVWNLTEKGLATVSLCEDDVKTILKTRRILDDSLAAKPEFEEGVLLDELKQGYQEELLALLKKLPPEGFERLCQRLLRESGFEKVQVTGRTGDCGIDGEGIVKINTFVSFKVLFQCKRYDGSVGPSEIRDFRGTMQGRADKGIVLTTGTFTKAAHTEAERAGVPPIELVDGKQLVSLFESLELGLVPRTTFDVDNGFFEQFRNKPE